MSSPPASSAPRRRSRVRATFLALLRTRVTTGLLVLLPIYVTYWIVAFVFGIMRDSSKWIVEAFLRSRYGAPFLESWKVNLEAVERRLGHTPTPEELVAALPNSIQWGVAIASVLLTIVLLYLIGLFAANIVGKRIIGAFELILDRLPVVKGIYRASKQILATFSGEQAQSFRGVALFPFMGERTRSLGFITNVFRDDATGEEMCSIFVPTTPNPTSGFVLICRRAEVIELGWNTEEAIKAIISAGIILPARVDFRTSVNDLLARPLSPWPAPPRV